ncbi:LuxR C-terminal-related transcriptional regulator [Curvivirga sp.]|uniref:response regulator transcription factor n=1 Tax=Curvivirga sp. TaxID=2856848 RepID=UPI003B59A55B
MNKYRIAVADKNPLVLSGLETLFKNDDRFTLTGTARTGAEFIGLAAQNKFDIGITGWEMPGLDGRAILDAIGEFEYHPKIVIYTGVPNPRIIREAMLNGAAGFCAKGDSTEQLITTVASVAAGQMVFPYFDLKKLQDDPWESLTRRELDLLDYLKTGQSNQQIANYLGLSVNTIKFHLKNLYTKLGVKNRAQAVAVSLSRKSNH